MSSQKPVKKRKILAFPSPPEAVEEKAFTDHYLQLADKLLTPNLQRETPDDKTEPYLPPNRHRS